MVQADNWHIFVSAFDRRRDLDGEMHKGSDNHPYTRAEDAEMRRQENSSQDNAEIVKKRSERIGHKTVKIIQNGGKYRRQTEEKNCDKHQSRQSCRRRLIFRTEFSDKSGDKLMARKKEYYEKNKIKNYE